MDKTYYYLGYTLYGAFQGNDYYESIFVVGVLEVLSKSNIINYSTEKSWKEKPVVEY